MEFYTLASGSSGNCSLVCAGDTLLLIDAGISCRRIEQSLRALGRTLGDLTAVFITHEHADHVGGLATLSKKSAAPVYVTRGVSHILTCPVVAFTAGDTLKFAGCTVRSFSTSHDAVDPVGYRLLAHLSKENNTPELAEYAVARALQSAGLSVRLGVAPRDTMSEVHLCRRSPSFASAN